MNLVDLKIPKKSRAQLKKENMPAAIGGEEKYPYGFRFTFGREQINKFPQLKGVTVGEKIGLSGIGEVIEVRKIDRQGYDNQFSVEVQIQKVGVKTKTSGKKESLIGAIEKSKKGELK